MNATDTESGETTEEIYMFKTEKENSPPGTPSIDGPINGKVGTEYDFNISGEDIDGDDIWILVEWGDGTNTSWLGPYSNSYEITESHTWKEKGTYTIRAKAKDEHGVESDWGILKVTMPKSQNEYMVSRIVGYVSSSRHKG